MTEESAAAVRPRKKSAETSLWGKLSSRKMEREKYGKAPIRNGNRRLMVADALRHREMRNLRRERYIHGEPARSLEVNSLVHIAANANEG